MSALRQNALGCGFAVRSDVARRAALSGTATAVIATSVPPGEARGANQPCRRSSRAAEAVFSRLEDGTARAVNFR